jgi:hypothetical protein
MAGEVEYTHNAFPNYRASVHLLDRDGLGKCGRTTVLGFDGAC